MFTMKKMAMRKQAYRDVFDSIKGEEVILDLLRKAFQLRDGSAVRDVDPQSLAYFSGQRDLVLYILRQLNRDDAATLGLIQEGITKETVNE